MIPPLARMIMRGRVNCEECGHWRHVTDFRPTQWLWGNVIRIAPDCNSCHRRGAPQGDYIVIPHLLREAEYVKALQPAPKRRYVLKPKELKPRPKPPRFKLKIYVWKPKKHREPSPVSKRAMYGDKNRRRGESEEQFRQRERERKKQLRREGRA